MELRLFVGNDNVVELRELRNSVTDAVDTAATVSFTLQTEDGVDLAGPVWPLSMPYDAGSGAYRVVLPASIPIVEGDYYVGVVDVVGSGSETGRFEIGLPAVVRRRN